VKIWLLRRRYNPLGGAERFTNRLAQRLHTKGYEVLIAAENWPDSKEGFYKVKTISSHHAKEFSRHCFQEIASREKNGIIFSLERTVQQHIYRAGDGVHASWLARRSKFQNIFQNLWTPFDPKHRGILELEKKVFSREGSNHVLINSNLVKQEILERFNFPQENISMICSGVNLKHFYPCTDSNQRGEFRKKLALPKDAIVWCFVGSGFERKGLRWAIQIAAKQKEKVFLVVLGKGNNNRYKRLAESEGLLDRLIFAQTGTSALEIYQACDTFILPTIYDPCSNATLEAAACGLPIITTTANGACEFVPSTALEDPSDVNKAVEQTENYARPLTLAANLNQIRSQLDEKPHWEKLIDLIQKISLT
jgi:UDP-glucose:(heptosyl)LPS alpha-1,3-glucosyltransferase